jgi:hypothetical protein
LLAALGLAFLVAVAFLFLARFGPPWSISDRLISMSSGVKNSLLRSPGMRLYFSLSLWQSLRRVHGVVESSCAASPMKYFVLDWM